jgi:hypothetical protein
VTESGVVQERVRPFSNTVTGGWKGRLARVVRLLGDLQLLTIERDLRAVMPSWRGDVLDVGCGSSPFKHLLNPDVTNYTGVDIADADGKFGPSGISVGRPLSPAPPTKAVLPFVYTSQRSPALASDRWLAPTKAENPTF